MKKTTLLISSLLMLAGCQHMPGSSLLVTGDDSGWQSADFNENRLTDGSKLSFDLADLIPKNKVNTSTRALVAEGAVALDKGDLEKASQLFNTALRLDISNSQLHFLNALTYHLLAKGGNAKNYEFAEQGYQLAYKFDNTNTLAKSYLGLAYLDQRKFKEAQGALAAAAVMDETDPDILYDLARASYFAGDPRTSKAALDKIQSMVEGATIKDKVMRANVLTDAALGIPVDMEKLSTQFSNNPKIYNFLKSRVSSWESFHEDARNGKFQQATFKVAQVLPKTDGIQRIPGASSEEPNVSQSNSESADFINDDMVFVDVVIIRTQEDVSTNRGMNLLSGLELQFGDPLTNTPGFSEGNLRINDRTAANADTKTRTVSSLISIPAVNYSLNIFNTLDARNEVLASPSLVALANEKSEFFSGTDVVAAAVSGGDGSSISVNKKIGVKLAVTPEFLPSDYIKLEVEAERTFLTSPSSSVQFEFRLDTSNTNVNANVVMKFGETLILSGLSEKETENTRDAVPLLGDVPVIQYLFSKQAKRDFRKSVLIMLTPRRAQYTNRDAKDRAETEASLSDFEKSLSTFEYRNEDWFVPLATIDQAKKVAESNSLFNQFKTGDFQMENWNGRGSNKKRLGTVVDFLYY